VYRIVCRPAAGAPWFVNVDDLSDGYRSQKVADNAAIAPIVPIGPIPMEDAMFEAAITAPCEGASPIMEQTRCFLRAIPPPANYPLAK